MTSFYAVLISFLNFFLDFLTTTVLKKSVPELFGIWRIFNTCTWVIRSNNASLSHYFYFHVILLLPHCLLSPNQYFVPLLFAKVRWHWLYVVWDDILRLIFEYSGSQATRSNYQRVYKANAVFAHGRKPHTWRVVSLEFQGYCVILLGIG